MSSWRTLGRRLSSTFSTASNILLMVVCGCCSAVGRSCGATVQERLPQEIDWNLVSNQILHLYVQYLSWGLRKQHIWGHLRADTLTVVYHRSVGHYINYSIFEHANMLWVSCVEEKSLQLLKLAWISTLRLLLQQPDIVTAIFLDNFWTILNIVYSH